MSKLRKILVIGVIAALFALCAAAIPAAGQAGTLTSTPDVFDQKTGMYSSIYAGSHVFELPVINNDASKNAPDVMICRLRPTDSQTLSYGYASLRDGEVELFIDPYYKKATIKLLYQLCDKEVVGPETLVTVNVRPLRFVGAKVIDGRRIKLTNRNPDPISCTLSNAGPSSETYFRKSIAGNHAVVVKARFHTSDYRCSIGKYRSSAGDGVLVANRVH